MMKTILVGLMMICAVAEAELCSSNCTPCQSSCTRVWPQCPDGERPCVTQGAVPAKRDCNTGECGTDVCEKVECLPNTPEKDLINQWTKATCTDHCPVFDPRTSPCLPDEHRCEGVYDQNGCKGPYTCVKYDKCTKNPEDLCPKAEYDHMGCPLRKECEGAQVSCLPAKKPEGKEHCDMERFKTCHNHVDENGCNHQCHQECGDVNKIACWDDFDMNGCALFSCQEETCPPKTHDQRGCPVVIKPNTCMEKCLVGYDDKGCHMGWMCKDGSKCPKLSLPTHNPLYKTSVDSTDVFLHRPRTMGRWPGGAPYIPG